MCIFSSVNCLFTFLSIFPLDHLYPYSQIKGINFLTVICVIKYFDINYSVFCQKEILNLI